MSQKFSIWKGVIALGVSTLFAISGHAMATTTDLGVQSAPASLTFGNSFASPQTQFYDDYLFTMSPGSVDTIASTISLGSLFGINNLQARLYSGTVTTTGKPTGLLEAWSTAIQITGNGYTGSMAVISPITLGAGSYVLEIRGDAVGTAGGSYAGTLNISPVPEAEPWVMLLVGLGLIGFVTLRRKKIEEDELSGKYGTGKYGIYREGAKVIDSFIHALSWDETLKRIGDWAKARESRYVCICNVHSVITATHDKDFKHVLRHADLATPDGMPIAWMLRKLGFAGQERINGPDLMWRYCEQAAQSGEPVFFYGSTFETLRLMSQKLKTAFPGLHIAGVYSPPFRDEDGEEEGEIISFLNASEAGVVFIGLGCPKQEKWMATHRAGIQAVLIGVGAAFDYHAGTLQRAPLWMQRNGLEWAFRLFSDPRRLWKRYLVTNTLFIFKAIMQLLQHVTREINFPRTASRHPALKLGQHKDVTGRVQA